MKDFHELDCSLKFADLFIVVLTTFDCWNQMIPYTIFLVCLLCSVFKGLSRRLAATRISYHLHSRVVKQNL